MELQCGIDEAAALVQTHAARGAELVYLGTRHDALRCGAALSFPKRTTLRFSPYLPRTALQAAAAALRQAVCATGHVAFSDDQRLFCNPCLAR